MMIGMIWALILVTSGVYTLVHGQASEVSTAFLNGAKQGVEMTLLLAGPLCLWTGLAKLASHLQLMQPLNFLLCPLLGRVFPSSRKDPELREALTANFTANLLGLGSAATPMGIRAVRRLQTPAHPELATDELCRLVVLNTASVQLLPTTVAAIRSGAGAAAPFDILPCVWISSLLSVSAGLATAFLLGKLWKCHG